MKRFLHFRLFCLHSFFFFLCSGMVVCLLFDVFERKGEGKVWRVGATETPVDDRGANIGDDDRRQTTKEEKGEDKLFGLSEAMERASRKVEFDKVVRTVSLQTKVVKVSIEANISVVEEEKKQKRKEEKSSNRSSASEVEDLGDREGKEQKEIPEATSHSSSSSLFFLLPLHDASHVGYLSASVSTLSGSSKEQLIVRKLGTLSSFRAKHKFANEEERRCLVNRKSKERKTKEKKETNFADFGIDIREKDIFSELETFCLDIPVSAFTDFDRFQSCQPTRLSRDVMVFELFFSSWNSPSSSSSSSSSLWSIEEDENMSSSSSSPSSSSSFKKGFLSDTQLSIVYYLGHSLCPLPKVVKLGDTQLVSFFDIPQFLCSHVVKRQTTIYKLPLDKSSKDDRNGSTHLLENYEELQSRLAPFVGSAYAWSSSSSSSSSLSSSPSGGSYVLKEQVGNVSALQLRMAPLRLHFPLKKHLGFFSAVERRVDVSHWGSVAFHEVYDLQNAAAGLDGEFSRSELSAFAPSRLSKLSNRMSRQSDRILNSAQQDEADDSTNPPSHLLVHLDAALPRRVFGLEFFDKIGNVSSSEASRVGSGPSYTSLHLEPRFPLLGSWKTDFQLQYSVPLRTVLTLANPHNQESVTSSSLSSSSNADDVALGDGTGVSSATHVLNITFGTPIRGMFVDQLLTKVTLPHGSSQIRVWSPRELQANWTESSWGWFDLFSPKPVVSLYSRNLFVPDKQLLQYRFQVFYDYKGTLADAQKPLILCFLFLLPFLLCIVSARVTVRLTTKKESVLADRRHLRLSLLTHLKETYEDFGGATDDLMSAAENHSLRPLRHQLEEAKQKWENMSLRVAQNIDDIILQLLSEPQFQKLPNAFQTLKKAAAALASSTAYSQQPTSNAAGSQMATSLTLQRQKLRDAQTAFVNLLNADDNTRSPPDNLRPKTD